MENWSLHPLDVAYLLLRQMYKEEKIASITFLMVIYISIHFNTKSITITFIIHCLCTLLQNTVNLDEINKSIFSLFCVWYDWSLEHTFNG